MRHISFFKCKIESLVRVLFLPILFFALSISIQAQAEIQFKNPSLDGVARAGQRDYEVVEYWENCGRLKFEQESAPDVHPGDIWGVTHDPSDGKSFIGLVTRKNGSYESIGQELSEPLLANKKYTLSADIARSENFNGVFEFSSYFKYDTIVTSFAVLRIWGATGACENDELLFTSDPIKNTEWKTNNIEIEPKEDYNFIVLEAYYQDSLITPYNSHLLLDNLTGQDRSFKNIYEERKINNHQKTKTTVNEKDEVQKYSGPTKSVLVKKAYNSFFIEPAQTEYIDTQYVYKQAHREGAIFEKKEEQVFYAEGYEVYQIIEPTFKIKKNKIKLSKRKKEKIGIYTQVTEARAVFHQVPSRYVTRPYYELIKDGNGPEVRTQYQTLKVRRVIKEAKAIKYLVPDEYLEIPLAKK